MSRRRQNRRPSTFLHFLGVLLLFDRQRIGLRIDLVPCRRYDPSSNAPAPPFLVLLFCTIGGLDGAELEAGRRTAAIEKLMGGESDHAGGDDDAAAVQSGSVFAARPATNGTPSSRSGVGTGLPRLLARPRLQLQHVGDDGRLQIGAGRRLQRRGFRKLFEYFCSRWSRRRCSADERLGPCIVRPAPPGGKFCKQRLPRIGRAPAGSNIGCVGILNSIGRVVVVVPVIGDDRPCACSSAFDHRNAVRKSGLWVKRGRFAEHAFFFGSDAGEFEPALGMRQHHLPRTELIGKREIAGPQSVVRRAPSAY